MSLMERMKRSGPRIDPWGTPERTEVGLDMRLPTLTNDQNLEGDERDKVLKKRDLDFLREEAIELRRER